MRSEADNLHFDERTSAPRRQAFEETAKDAVTHSALRRAHTDYALNHVFSDEVPDTFKGAMLPAGLGELDPAQKVIRVESLVRPLEKMSHPITFARLTEAVSGNENEVVDGFLRVWNDSNVRDGRPVFAAFKDEVLEELAAPDWANRLRDRLGLAQYNCADGPIPVALMEYTVEEVLNAAKDIPGVTAFTVPTALDSEPWPHFFPAPEELPCGRAMPTFQEQDDENLLAELLHFRLEYRREHINRVGEISEPPDPIDLKALRNHHLLALRLASKNFGYGEEIP